MPSFTPMLAAIFGGLAAGLWLVASLVRVRPMLEMQISGKGSLEDTLSKQSRWNALGAFCASVSAGLQAVMLIWPISLS